MTLNCVPLPSMTSPMRDVTSCLSDSPPISHAKGMLRIGQKLHVPKTQIKTNSSLTQNWHKNQLHLFLFQKAVQKTGLRVGRWCDAQTSECTTICNWTGSFVCVVRIDCHSGKPGKEKRKQRYKTKQNNFPSQRTGHVFLLTCATLTF